MRRQGNNRDMRPSASLAFANRRGRVESIHLGHLHVHQDQIEHLPVATMKAVISLSISPLKAMIVIP